MQILFLHLSDLHFSKASDFNTKYTIEICKALSSRKLCKVDSVFLLVTGDLAFSGTTEQYEVFNEFLTHLTQELQGCAGKSIPIHTFLVPGNHDIDFKGIEDRDRAFYESCVCAGDAIDCDEATARSQFRQYAQSQGIQLGENQFLFRALIDVGGYTVEVNMLDSTWFSLKEKNDQGLHWIPKETMEQLRAPTGANMVITLMHHSHQWFNESCKNELEQTLLEKSTMIFLGHEHYIAQQTVAYNGFSPAHVFCGGKLCDRGNWENGRFFAGVFDTETEKHSYYEFLWNKDIYCGGEPKSERITAKPSSDTPASIDQEFWKKIMYDSMAGISSELSDYYVFPVLAKQSSGEDDHPVDVFDFERFYNEFEKCKHIELAGGDDGGKSALLKMIFKHYARKRCVLLCQVSDITSGNRQRIIKNIFETIYGEADYEKFLHLDKSQKMILIDDLHLVSPKHVSDFLAGIEEEFGYIVYTTSNTIKLDIQERIKAAVSKSSFAYYHMMPLSEAKRRELVERVLPLKLSGCSPEEISVYVDKITEALTVQRRYIPLTPGFILQFIQFYVTYQMEALQNDGSIFGKVFEASITNTLSQYVKMPMTVDKAFTVLGKIAYNIHEKTRYPISDKQIMEVIEEYCTEYGCKMDGVDFINAMTNAQILRKCEESGQYKFCSTNYLAYFVAREICASRNVESVKKCLELACFGINATILMFVTYITNDESVVQAIYERAYQVTSQWEEFSFGMSDLSHINGVKPSSPILPPSDQDREQDKLDEEEKDRQETQNAVIDIMNVYDYREEDAQLFKNQLLGAVASLGLLARCLPNFEHMLKKDRKEEIVRALYELPNKIFFAWASEVEKDREELVNFVASLETNKFTRKKLSEGEARAVIQWQSLSLLLELYYGVASNAYRENTLEYLDDMARNCVDMEERTHALERLVVLSRAKRIEDFKYSALKLNDTMREPAARLALDRIVYRVLLQGGIGSKHADEIKSKFFPGTNNPKIILQQRQADKRK